MEHTEEKICPVCGGKLPEPIPLLCPTQGCNWDLQNDPTLTPTLGDIPQKIIEEYQTKLSLARQNWTSRQEDARRRRKLETEIARLKEEKEERRQQRVSEENFWQEVVTVNRKEGYESYLQRYPSGIYAGLATRRMGEIIREEELHHQINLDQIKGLEEAERRQRESQGPASPPGDETTSASLQQGTQGKSYEKKFCPKADISYSSKEIIPEWYQNYKNRRNNLVIYLMNIILPFVFFGLIPVVVAWAFIFNSSIKFLESGHLYAFGIFWLLFCIIKAILTTFIDSLGFLVLGIYVYFGYLFIIGICALLHAPNEIYLLLFIIIAWLFSDAAHDDAMNFHIINSSYRFNFFYKLYTGKDKN